MKKMCRYFCMVVAVIMVTSILLTGCTDKTGGTTDTVKSGGDTITSEPTSKALDPYEIHWYLGCGAGSQPDSGLIEQELNKYLKDKINVSVKLFIFDWGSYQDKMRAILASGGKVDMFFSCGWSMNYKDMARGGWSLDITDMIAEYAPHANEVLDGPFIEYPKVDGRLYNLACNKEKAANAGVLLNKAYVDKYGFDLSSIKKYEDLLPMLKTIKENEPDAIPIDSSPKSNIGFMAGLVCLGNGLLNYFVHPKDSDEFVFMYDVPEILELVQTQRRFAEEGLIMPDAITVTDKNPALKSGKVFCSHEQLKPGKDAEMTVATGVEWVQVVLTPTLARDFDGSMMAVAKNCVNPERVLMFYDMFYYDEYLVNLMDYGIEDVHYVKVEDNIIDWAPATEGGAKSGWNHGVSWVIGNQFLSYLLKDEDPLKWVKFQEFNDAGVITDSTYFIFDQAPVDNYISQLRAVSNSEDVMLKVGLADDIEGTISSFRAKLNAAGLQEILDEVNRQFREYKANR